MTNVKRPLLERRLKTSQITLQKLEVFHLVVRLGSVTRAAERLGIAQPAVTSHLRSLEDKVGATLLRRDGRNLVLTETGERIHTWADEVIARSYEMERDLSGLRDGASGNVVIASTMAAGSYSVTDIVVEFLKKNEGAKLAIQISNPKVVLESVRTGACDFAVLILDPSQNIEGLIVQKLWDEPLVLTAARESNRVGSTASNSLLQEMDFITPPRGLVTRDLEDEMLHVNGVTERNVVLELGHPEAMKRAVKSDIGVSFLLATTIREELQSGVLRRVETPELANFTIPLFLVYRRKKTLSKLQRRLLDFIAGWKAMEEISPIPPE
jgi:LysR family transcriptional regulator, low CO2-responsive transcriptional regulator